MTPNSAFVWGAGGARMTPEQIESQKKVAQALMDKGMDYSPIQSPWQGAARVAQALMGGFKDAEATEAGRANDAADKEMLASLMGGGSSGGDKTDSVPNAGVQPMTDSVPNAGVQPMGSVPNAGVQPMARLPPMSSRIYEEHEFNPIDAMNATPEELAAGVRAPKQYAALIGKAAVDNDLPPELIVALIKQESGFNPNAVSSAGAQGIAQFMPETAREMGVNPLDPASAIPGAAKYLRQNIDKFGGSIPLGLAAYNAGPGRVERSGGDISRLPAETQGYVRNITGAAPVRTAQASPMAGVNPKVLEAATSRYSSPQTKTIANIILQQQMKQGQQANDPLRRLQIQKAERDLQGEGATPLSPAERAAFGFPDGQAVYKTRSGEIKFGPAGTKVTTNVGGEGNKFYEELDKAQAKLFSDLQTQGQNAAQSLMRIDRLDRLLSNVPTGAEANFKMIAGNWGIKTDGLDEIQAAQALINQIVPLQRPPGSGPMSDADLEMFKKSVPRIIAQPGGNKLIIDTMRAVNQYVMQQGRIADAVANREMTPVQGRAALQKLTNPLDGLRQSESQSAAPSGVDKKLWDKMTPEEKALWN